MKRLALLGIIVTCLTNAEHNEYTDFQVDGAITYDGQSLLFADSKGDRYRADSMECQIMEGTLKEPGEDVRDDIVRRALDELPRR